MVRVLMAVIAIRSEHATVFSVQHLYCFNRGVTILDSHSASLDASLSKPGWGHSVNNQF